MPPFKKFIVGIDYGTTHSGICISASQRGATDDVQVLVPYPGSRDYTGKAPTAIAYASENPNLDGDVWGFEVTPQSRSYVGTKLLLEMGSFNVDGLAFKALYGDDFAKVPDHKSAHDPCADFFRGLHRFLMQKVEREFSSDAL
jgi:molecular chaperone DnaK (HSP70)